MRSFVVALALSPLLTGCLVAQSTYDAKVAELDALKAEETKHDQDSAEKIKALQAEQDKLQKELASAQLQNGDLTAQTQKLGESLKQLAAEKGILADSLAALQKQEEQERARAALYHSLVQKLKSMIDSGKLAVQVRNGKMLVKLQNDILFGAGSAAVKPEGKEVLGQLAQVLTSVDRNYQVTGHTDDVPIHSAQFPSNWELSTARAINVVNILTGAGLDPKHVSAAGYAENDPVAPNDTPDNKQKNRRIEIVVQPNIDELPKFDEPGAGANKS